MFQLYSLQQLELALKEEMDTNKFVLRLRAVFTLLAKCQCVAQSKHYQYTFSALC